MNCTKDRYYQLEFKLAKLCDKLGFNREEIFYNFEQLNIDIQSEIIDIVNKQNKVLENIPSNHLRLIKGEINDICRRSKQS
jgi:hypothetical protein